MKKKSILALSLISSLCTISAHADTVPVINMPNGFTADSQKIIFQSHVKTSKGGFKTEIFSMNLDGSEMKKEIIPGVNPGWPEFTKDGMRVAYFALVNSNFDLLVADLAEANNLSEYTKVNRITNHPKEDFFVSWSPNEEKLAFYTHRDEPAQIYVMSAKGGDVKNLSNNKARESDPDWSSQDQITFQSNLTGNNDVWVMDGDGKNRKNLTNHPSEDHFGDWSPDGEHIVFSSDRDGDHDLYIIKKDGTGLRQLTNAEGTDRWPLWSPDGKTITFSRVVNKWSNVFTITPDGKTEKQLTENRSYH